MTFKSFGVSLFSFVLGVTLFAMPARAVSAQDDRTADREASRAHIVFFLDKTSLITDLLKLVQSLVTEAHPKLRKSSALSRLVESSDLKPGWFGISLDLKRLFKRK